MAEETKDKKDGFEFFGYEIKKKPKVEVFDKDGNKIPTEPTFFDKCKSVGKTLLKIGVVGGLAAGGYAVGAKKIGAEKDREINSLKSDNFRLRYTLDQQNQSNTSDEPVETPSSEEDEEDVSVF